MDRQDRQLSDLLIQRQQHADNKDYYHALLQISKWIEHKVEAPEKYKPMIRKIDKAKEAIKKLTKDYEGTKEKYYGEVEKPLTNLKIIGFLNELSQI